MFAPQTLIYRCLGFEWRPHRTDAKLACRATQPIPYCSLPRCWGSALTGSVLSLAGIAGRADT